VLAKELDVNEFGPNIDFREYSFLNNTLVSSSNSSSGSSCSGGKGQLSPAVGGGLCWLHPLILALWCMGMLECTLVASRSRGLYCCLVL
jgi:hypothetical protein